MRKLNIGLLIFLMLFSFASTAFADENSTTGTYTHSGGVLRAHFWAYDSHISGYMYFYLYKVTPTGDVYVDFFYEEGGRPGHDIHEGSWYFGDLPAGNYKYVVTMPSGWMGPSVWFSN